MNSKLKPTEVQIVSISASPDNIYGLGDDQKIYWWHSLRGNWMKNWMEDDES